MNKLYLIAAVGALIALLCACASVASGSGVDGEEPEAYVTEIPAATNLTVYGFQAGKADAFLFTTPESAVLIDAGEKGFGKNILEYLNQAGVEKLDYLIITHFDQDHVGGAARILNRFPVETVLQSNSPKDSTEYEKYVKALKNADLEPVTVQEDMTFVLDGVVWTVNPPKRTSYASDNSNNSSLIVTIANGENRLLFMGDAQTERIEEFLNWNKSVNGGGTFDLLKIPHHGKEEPLMEELLEAVRPAYAVITSSEEEPEENSVLKALDAAGVEVYLTRTAPVWVFDNGKTLQISDTPDAFGASDNVSDSGTDNSVSDSGTEDELSALGGLSAA